MSFHPLHTTEPDSFSERSARITRGHELLPHVPVVTTLSDGAHNRRIVQLLRVVQLVAAGVAGRVEVADVLDVLTDRANVVSSYAFCRAYKTASSNVCD